jgi:hypothetical protein
VQSGVVRRLKNSLKEGLIILLSAKSLPEKNKKNISELFDLEEGEVNYSCAITAKLIELALSGNLEAYRLIRGTLEQDPVKKIQGNLNFENNVINENELLKIMREKKTKVKNENKSPKGTPV